MLRFTAEDTEKILDTSENSNSAGAKLLKLEISKFQGTFLDWTRFWNQFETEMDKVKLTQVASFLT